MLELCALALAAGVRRAADRQRRLGPRADRRPAGPVARQRLQAIQSASSRVKISGSFLAIVIAAVFLGERRPP